MPATVLKFFEGAARQGGKTALQWHLLKQESTRLGRPILCVECDRPHQAPPPFGRCPCGCYAFGIKAAGPDPQLALELDFHGGEK